MNHACMLCRMAPGLVQQWLHNNCWCCWHHWQRSLRTRDRGDSAQAFDVALNCTCCTKLCKRLGSIWYTELQLDMQAPPGSGKTLAFLLPIATKLVECGHGRNTRPLSPLALIISPTHELAQQTQLAATPLQQLFGLRSMCVHGGASREQQTVALQQRPHVLIATPGRCGKLLLFFYLCC